MGANLGRMAQLGPARLWLSLELDRRRIYMITDRLVFRIACLSWPEGTTAAALAALRRALSRS